MHAHTFLFFFLSENGYTVIKHIHTHVYVRMSLRVCVCVTDDIFQNDFVGW